VEEDEKREQEVFFKQPAPFLDNEWIEPKIFI
jgi:hypothetical protein